MRNLTIVLDVGKTLSKLSLWTSEGEIVARESRTNERIEADGYVALDAAGIEAWMADVLRDFAAKGTIKAIVPVGHGAAAAFIKDGRLAMPPLDYEWPIPAPELEEYRAGRPAFAETGSPPLPDGLNLGAQIHWLQGRSPGLLSGDALILPWPQYWAWRLCGVAASEVTSLGCHSDLWNPVSKSFSSLAVSRGWDTHIPPLCGASEALGPVLGHWVERCGLPPGTLVHCGIHDTNAALLAARGFAEIADHESTVLSTGTWFVAMRSPGLASLVRPEALAERRDCLVNVDAMGRPIPSARFMGGREVERLTGIDTRRIDIKPDQPALIAASEAVLQNGAQILPTHAPGFGPFAQLRGRWIDKPAGEAAQRAAVSIYAALVADTSLGLIGARERIVVEGRFAEAEVFMRTLASLRPRDRIYRSHAHSDVSYGALRLLNPSLKPLEALQRVEPLAGDIESYRASWIRNVELAELAA